MFFTWNAAIKTHYNCTNINIFSDIHCIVSHWGHCCV